MAASAQRVDSPQATEDSFSDRTPTGVGSRVPRDLHQPPTSHHCLIARETRVFWLDTFRSIFHVGEMNRRRKSRATAPEPVTIEVVQNRIHLIRGQKVMLDSELAGLYGVATKTLNRAVKRHIARFPCDFLLHITRKEVANLRYQIGTSKIGRGGRRYRPYAFTEQGVAMLSSVLNSERAVQVNILIVRAFVQLRTLLASHRELAAKLTKLERKLEGHDVAIRNLFDTIRAMLADPPGPKRLIGFNRDQEQPE